MPEGRPLPGESDIRHAVTLIRLAAYDVWRITNRLTWWAGVRALDADTDLIGARDALVDRSVPND